MFVLLMHHLAEATHLHNLPRIYSGPECGSAEPLSPSKRSQCERITIQYFLRMRRGSCSRVTGKRKVPLVGYVLRGLQGWLHTLVMKAETDFHFFLFFLLPLKMWLHYQAVVYQPENLCNHWLVSWKAFRLWTHCFAVLYLDNSKSMNEWEMKDDLR